MMDSCSGSTVYLIDDHGSMKSDLIFLCIHEITTLLPASSLTFSCSVTLERHLFLSIFSETVLMEYKEHMEADICVGLDFMFWQTGLFKQIQQANMFVEGFPLYQLLLFPLSWAALPEMHTFIPTLFDKSFQLTIFQCVNQLLEKRNIYLTCIF